MMMDLKEAEKLYEEGQSLCDNGEYEAAARVLKQAAQKTESYRDNQSSKAERKNLQDVILEIWDWYAVALHRAKKYEDAVACNNHNLSVRLDSSDYGPGHETTLENRRQLVANYSALGQHDNAIAECREILKTVDGSDDRNNLAQQLYHKGDTKSVKEAVNINLYTLKRDEKMIGKSHFSLCQARHNLGVELYNLGKFEDARDILQDNETILKGHPKSGSPERHARLLRDSEKTLACCISKIEEKEELRKEKERRTREETERKEKERLEKERAEMKRMEEKRLEKEKLAKERLEKERLEKERREKECLEQEQHKERDRLEQERKQRDGKEKERRQTLIKKIKDVQDRGDRRVRTGNSLGLSPWKQPLALTPELEKNGDIAAMETLCRSLEGEVRDWDRRLKTAEIPKPSSLNEPEPPRGRSKRTSSSPSLPVPEIRQPTTNGKRASSRPQEKKPTSPSVAPSGITITTGKTKSTNGTSSDVSKTSNPKFIMPTKIKGEVPTDQNSTTAKYASQTSNVPQIVYNDDTRPRISQRSRSNETLRSDATGLRNPGRALGRCSSVGSRNRPSSASGNLYSANLNSAETKADTWFNKLGDTAHRFLAKYKDYRFEGKSKENPEDERKPYNRVKIAVIDTGAANSVKFGTPETIRISKPRISWCKLEGNTLSPREDEDGHGTQVASIILKVTPYAKLYIYRVVRRWNDCIQPKIVAAALEDAVKRGIDIVNISFGWDHEIGEGHDQLRTALGKCNESGVLVFAATSNDGLDSVSGMAYPARADCVIAIDAASSDGEWLHFNPSRDNEYKTHRLTALGKAVKTDFPPQLGTGEGWERMDGTSAATPIAAGIAALVLEFARQPPLGYAPEVAKVLKRPEAMREVLAGAVAVKRTKNGEYRHLVPGRLFKCDSDSGDAGDWYSLTSRRREAVESVMAILKNKYGHKIARPMSERIQLEWAQMGRR